jgi:glucose-6-phosphate dehydrogenase assembly protein OpcA
LEDALSPHDDSFKIQQIVEPSEIEPQLFSLWEKLAKENKTRASLFNLIVFNRLSARTDYIRSIVEKVVEQFPCRTLFISYDPDAVHPYLKTAISVVTPKGAESGVACDQIDIGVGGPDLERVPFLLLPHLIPDLPVYLLWTEDPSTQIPLFAPLSQLATRIIFDSESADNLFAFAKTLLNLRAKTGIDIADLNWARTEGWRDLVASLFDSQERLSDLTNLSLVKFTYNSRETEFFCHLKIQAMYLTSWLSKRLHWKFQKATRRKNNQELYFQFDQIDVCIGSEHWEKLGPGTVISANFQTQNGHLFEAGRIPDRYHHVKICISTQERCELPYQFVLGQTATGQSLVKEICTKGTSLHYLEMLQELTILDQDKLC